MSIKIRQTTKHQNLIGPRVSAALLAALIFLSAMSGFAAAQCGDWELVPTPNVGDSVTRLRAVTALSSDNAWSVGLWRDVSGVFGPLALRWNGTTWSRIDLPNTSHLGALPETEGVESANNGDVWVVGKVFTGYPTDNSPLVLRWREDAWDYVQTVTLRPQTVYPFGPRGGLLYEIDSLAPDDIWAVGQASGYGDGGATTVPLAAHWDGSSWTDVEVPRVATRHHALDDVVAISHDDVWAVGDYRSAAQAFHAVTYHWDGTNWSYVHNPIEDFPESGLDDVVATGPNDVWAIGGSPTTGVMLMHWDGNQWSLVQPPPNSGGSLAAVGPNDLWASGWNGFWHWDGSEWTEFPAAVPGSTYVIRSGGMEIVGDCNIWCVGFWTLEDGITSYTLAEKLTLNAGSVCAGSGTLVEGFGETGDFNATCGSDDSYWAAHGASLFFQISDPVVQFELTAIAPAGFGGGTISVDIEASKQSDLANLNLRGLLFNFTTGSYVSLPGVMPLATTDAVQNFALPVGSNRGDFIEPGTNEVRLLLQTIQTSGLPNVRTQLDEVLFNFE